MWYRCLLVLFISFFTFNYSVDASVCDNDHIKQLKEMASKIEVNYEYIDNSDKINEEVNDFISTNSYLLSVNLLSDELYISDRYNDYYYADSDGGLVNFTKSSGLVNFEIRSSRCGGYLLRKLSVKLPKFNTFSYKEECKKLEEYDLDVCDPWYQGSLSDASFYKEVNKYLEEQEIKDGLFDKIINFFKDYYLVIGGFVLVIAFIVVAIVVHRKRSVLE